MQIFRNKESLLTAKKNIVPKKLYNLCQTVCHDWVLSDLPSLASRHKIMGPQNYVKELMM